MTEEEITKTLDGHLLWLRGRPKPPGGVRADFTAADLRGVDLRGGRQYTDFRSACFRGADFRNTEIPFLGVRGADFTGADFRGADFTGSAYPFEWEVAPDFRYLDCGYADFTGADFRGATLRWYDFDIGDFRGARGVVGTWACRRPMTAYRPLGGTTMIRAGRRIFSLGEAREHWGRSRPEHTSQDPSYAPRMLRAVEYCAAELALESVD